MVKRIKLLFLIRGWLCCQGTFHKVLRNVCLLSQLGQVLLLASRRQRLWSVQNTIRRQPPTAKKYLAWHVRSSSSEINSFNMFEMLQSSNKQTAPYFHWAYKEVSLLVEEAYNLLLLLPSTSTPNWLKVGLHKPIPGETWGPQVNPFQSTKSLYSGNCCFTTMSDYRTPLVSDLHTYWIGPKLL